jgi:hypothetical protein
MFAEKSRKTECEFSAVIWIYGGEFFRDGIPYTSLLISASFTLIPILLEFIIIAGCPPQIPIYGL